MYLDRSLGEVFFGPGQGCKVEGTSESQEFWVVVKPLLTTTKGPKSHS